jgi:lactate permease
MGFAGRGDKLLRPRPKHRRRGRAIEQALYRHTVNTLLALIPLLLVIALLASGRASALAAGLAGLAATLAVAVLAFGASSAVLAREIPAGLWLAWHVVAIIGAGMFFHRCLQTREATPRESLTVGAPAGAATPRRLWPVCFLLAPFAESVTGFGIGYIIALGALARLGVGGVPALLLGLYSQSLVPWGALAIGTTVGATLAGLTPSQLGLASAVLQAPIHLFYLLLYWRFAREAGVAVPVAQKLDDVVWTALLLVLVWLVNRYSDAEIAGAAATAFLLALRFWRDERPDAARIAAALRVHAPYVALTLALCATRLVPPVRDLLKPLWSLRPYDNQPAFALFYTPAFWLVAIGSVVVLANRASLGRVAGEAARGAWRACAVTLAFVVMAALYVGTGMAHEVADALRLAAGRGAALGVPLLAAIGGFLTGSGSGANAMLMPMVVALAQATGVESATLASVQNSVSTNLTMLSPIRVSMGIAILGLAGADGALYRRAWPLALPSIAVGLAAIALLLV